MGPTESELLILYFIWMLLSRSTGNNVNEVVTIYRKLNILDF